MKSFFVLTILCLFACIVSAQVRRSSRNLQPLSKRVDNNSAGTQSGHVDMRITTPQNEAPDDTVTTVSFLGPKSGWGFVKVKSPYYTPAGKHVGTLPGGTLFKYNGVKTTSKNAVLVSTVKRDETWEGPFLLDCTDIAGYEGDPETLNPALVKNLADYFTLNGKIAERKAALEEEAIALNPNFNSARQAQQAYQDSIEKAAERERQMNTLTGARKVKADEALRALKYEQIRIKSKADQAAAAYKAWKDAHPIDPAKLADDAQIKTLEQERKAAAEKVPGLIPKESAIEVAR